MRHGDAACGMSKHMLSSKDWSLPLHKYRGMSAQSYSIDWLTEVLELAQKESWFVGRFLAQKVPD